MELVGWLRCRLLLDADPDWLHHCGWLVVPRVHSHGDLRDRLHRHGDVDHLHFEFLDKLHGLHPDPFANCFSYARTDLGSHASTCRSHDRPHCNPDPFADCFSHAAAC